MDGLYCNVHFSSVAPLTKREYADSDSSYASSNDSLVITAINSTLYIPGSDPLNILICSVVMCQQETMIDEGNEDGGGNNKGVRGSDEERGAGDSLQCANLYTSFSAMDLILEMHISPSSSLDTPLDVQEMGVSDSYQVMPLVARQDAHTLDTTLWTYEGANEGANGTIVVPGMQAFGTVSLFAIKQ